MVIAGTMKLYISLLVVAVVARAIAAPAEDAITDLPGLNHTIGFRHYSGYLSGAQGKQLHYW